MRKMRTLAVFLASLMILSGCSKHEEDDVDLTKDKIVVSDFTDFTYLMFTDGNTSVIKDADGNEYTIAYDGYYYDSDGNKILKYGAGDDNTAKLGKTSGALSKEYGFNGEYNDTVVNSENDELSDSNSSNSGGDDTYDNSFGVPAEEVISDWEQYREDVMRDNGILEEDKNNWHGHEDGMADYKYGSGDNKLASNKSYDTNIQLGDSIPAVVDISSLQSSGTGKVTGKIILDAEAYNEYGKSIYGDTQTDEEGNEFEVYYADILIGQSIDVYILATNDNDTIMSDKSTVTFDDNFSGEFNVSCNIPSGYTAYLIINGIPYNI